MQWRRGLGLLPLALLCVAWEVAVELKVYPTVLLPPPGKVAAVFVNDWETLLENAGASLARVVIGIGLLVPGRRAARPADRPLPHPRHADRLVDPDLPLGAADLADPMAILLLGIGDKPAIALIFLSACGRS